MRAVTSARVSRVVVAISWGRMRSHLDGHLQARENKENAGKPWIHRDVKYIKEFIRISM